MFRVGLVRLAGTSTNHCQSIRGASTASKKGVVAKLIEADLIGTARTFLQSPETQRALKKAIIELTPPTPAELPKAIKDGIRLFKGGNWKNVTMREAWLNTLVTTEVICWFFVGEWIGKGSLVGYQV